MQLLPENKTPECSTSGISLTPRQNYMYMYLLTSTFTWSGSFISRIITKELISNINYICLSCKYFVWMRFYAQFNTFFGHISAVGPQNQLFWITYHWLPWFLNQQWETNDHMINCHREIVQGLNKILLSWQRKTFISNF